MKNQTIIIIILIAIALVIIYFSVVKPALSSASSIAGTTSTVNKITSFLGL